MNSARNIAIGMFIVGAAFFTTGAALTGFSLCSSSSECLATVSLYQVDFAAPMAQSTAKLPPTRPAMDTIPYFDQELTGEVLWLSGLYAFATAALVILCVEILDPTLFGRAPKRRRKTRAA